MSKYINWRSFEFLYNKVVKNINGDAFDTSIKFESDDESNDESDNKSDGSSSPDTACFDIINNKMSTKFLIEEPI